MEIPIIWIIDDDMICRFSSNYKLEQSGKNHSVVGHDSAIEALTSLNGCIKKNQNIPDAILLDLNIPGMDGWTFLEELEKMGVPGEKIHVYIVSYFANSRDRQLANEHPFIKGFFGKPLTTANVSCIFNGIDVKNRHKTIG